MAEIEAEQSAKSISSESVTDNTESLPQIGIEDFGKIELRCAKVIECDKVKKSKKLLRLTVDLGFERRQVVSGIAQFYDPEDMIGRRVVLVSNLAPAKLCGIDSEGMILAAGDDSIDVVFLPDDVPLGSRIR